MDQILNGLKELATLKEGTSLADFTKATLSYDFADAVRAVESLQQANTQLAEENLRYKQVHAQRLALASDGDLSYLAFCERGATSGKWRIEFDIEDGKVTDKHVGIENEGGTLVIRDDWGYATQEDLEFICAARNILPGLLARLHKAEAAAPNQGKEVAHAA